MQKKPPYLNFHCRTHMFNAMHRLQPLGLQGKAFHSPASSTPAAAAPQQHLCRDISLLHNLEKFFSHLSHFNQGYSLLLTFLLACMILLRCAKAVRLIREAPTPVMYNYISSDSNQMLQSATKTVMCAVYIHWSLWRWKQWEIDCSTPYLEDNVTQSDSWSSSPKLLQTSPLLSTSSWSIKYSPPSALSSCSNCLSCCTRRNVVIKCGNWEHLSALPPRWWHTPPLKCSPTSVPKSSFLSVCFANALRQHLNFPLLYPFFVVFLLLSKPPHLYSSFHFFLSFLLLCTFFTGISHSFPT